MSVVAAAVPRPVAVFRDVLLAAVILGVSDVLLFHVGLYFPWIKPRSYSGRIESASRRLRFSLARRGDVPHVVIIGDSVTTHAMSEGPIEDQLAAAGLHVKVDNIAEGGATPNAWLPLLESEPIDGDRTPLVVLGIQPAAMECGEEPRPDVEIAKTRMSVRDAAALALRYRGTERRLAVLAGAIFRLPWFREDILDLLRAPRGRAMEIRHERALEARVRDGGRRDNAATRSLRSIRIGRRGTVSFARAEPWIAKNTELRKQVVWRMLELAKGEPPILEPDAGYMWSLRRTVELCNRRGISVLMAVTPGTPYPSRCRELVRVTEACEAMRARGADVALYWNQPLIHEVERPVNYLDWVHPNARGSLLYSCALAQRIAGDARFARMLQARPRRERR